MKLFSVLLFGDVRSKSVNSEEKLDVADERFFSFGSVGGFGGFGSVASGVASGVALGASGGVAGGLFGVGSSGGSVQAAEPIEEDTTNYPETYYSTASTGPYTTTTITTTTTTMEPTTTSFYSTTSNIPYPSYLSGDPWALSLEGLWKNFGTGTCKALVEEKTKPEADERCQWSCRYQGTNLTVYNPKGSYMNLIASVDHFRQTSIYSQACINCVELLKKAHFHAVEQKEDVYAKTWRNALWVSEDKYCPYGISNCDASDQTNFFYLTDYGNDIHCYHRFASECKYGVDVTIRQMRIEKTRQCYSDYIAFGYVNNDGIRKAPRVKDRMCGCLENNRQDGCKAAQSGPTGFDYYIFDLTKALSVPYVPVNTWYNTVPTTFSLTKKIGRTNMKVKLLGTDPIFTFASGGGNYGGEVVVEWQCMSEMVNKIYVHFNLPVKSWYSVRTTLRSELLKSIKEALLSDANRINPYGRSGDAVVQVKMSADGKQVNVTIELNGIPDNENAIDTSSVSNQVTQAAQATLSAPNFKEVVDASSITVKVKLPATVTNTEEMAEKILVGTKFTPNMASNHGCASEGFFDPFTKVHGKPRDATDTEFFKWKKCVQCALGGTNVKRITERYDYNEKDEVCGETNRALCECDLKLMTYLKDTNPSDGPYDMDKCIPADHHSQLECCNWRRHYWAAFNPDHFQCTREGPRERGDL